MIAAHQLRRREAGFTLVELLVSLAILALVAGLIAQALGANRRALRSIEHRTEAGEEVAWAQDQTRQDIEQLLARTRFVGPAPTIDFNGASQSLEFITLLQDSQGRPRVRRVRLDRSAAGDLELASSTPDGSPRFEAPTTLLRGVDNLRFRYYGPTSTPGDKASAVWRDQWPASASPPTLVNLVVTFPAGDRRIWPELLVRPVAQVDDACVFDADTGACRGRP